MTFEQYRERNAAMAIIMVYYKQPTKHSSIKHPNYHNNIIITHNKNKAEKCAEHSVNCAR